MIDEWLYPGCQVDFTQDQTRRAVKTARLWFVLKELAWVVTWEGSHHRQNVRIVPRDLVRVSQKPYEAPPMPKFTGVETPWVRLQHMERKKKSRAGKYARSAEKSWSITGLMMEAGTSAIC
jgi:hypothetical protein